MPGAILQDRRATFGPLIGVLPKKLGDALGDLVFASRATPDEAGVYADLMALAASAEAGANEVLDRLSPECVLDAVTVRKAVLVNKTTRAARSVGVNRFMWTLAVRGAGNETSYPVLKEYFEQISRWFAATQAAGLFAAPDSALAPGIANNPDHERVRRLAPTTVSFFWVTEYLSELIADCAASIPHAIEPFPSLDVVRELLDHLASVARTSEYTPSAQAETLSSEAIAVVRRISLPAGALAKVRPLGDVLLSTLIESHPFVDLSTGPALLGIREALGAFERVLLELARSTLGEQGRGDLFEAVAARCTDELGPKDLTVMAPPVSVGDAGSGAAGQVDFALLAERLVIVGECKAQLVARSNATVINAFSDQVGHAVEQLRVRLASFASGAPLRAADATVDATQQRRAIGLAVTLHPYGTAVWDRDTLSEIGGFAPDLVVMPLHQLAILIHAMGSADDLSDYLDLRHQLLSLGAVIHDEIDFLAFYLYPRRAEMLADLAVTGSPGGRVFFRPLTVPAQLAIELARPTSGAQWRGELQKVMTVRLWDPRSRMSRH